MPLEHVDPPFYVEPKPLACRHEGRRPYHLPFALDLLFVVQSCVNGCVGEVFKMSRVGSSHDT